MNTLLSPLESLAVEPVAQRVDPTLALELMLQWRSWLLQMRADLSKLCSVFEGEI